MDDILTCKYHNCNKYYVNPVILPCGKNICKIHTDEIINENKNILKCDYCDDEHVIPIPNGFVINQTLNEIINLNLHLNSKEKEANKTINTIEQSINEFSTVNNNPNEFIFGYVSEVREKINLEKDRLVTKIQLIAREMLDKLKIYEQKCKENMAELNELTEENKKHLDDLERRCAMWKDDLRRPNKNQELLDSLLEQLSLALRENEIKRIEYKNLLLLEYGCYFNPGNFEINQDLFGEFKLDETVNIASTERSKDFGLYHSNILTPNQALDLIRLCGFSNQDNFRLIYRATEDGFNSHDFHKKCDYVANTLTIVKVKDSHYIFGGYTQVPWDSSNQFRCDNNAFIFSLINGQNKPIRINVEFDHSAIYCGASSGPSFGSGCDFEIVTNSNVNERSYSKLCGSYKHPECSFNSNKANSFLAGKLEFGTEEIEVYALVLH